MNKLLKMLQIHGLDYNTGEVLSVNEDNSFNFLASDGIEYLIDGADIKIVGENKKEVVKRPRGWHLKPEFIDSQGNVYHKGVLQPYKKTF